ncbi:MAG TPA: serine protease [Flavobacteriales bacterium]|nr:serine protease [Flavobacteriales bacterium]
MKYLKLLLLMLISTTIYAAPGNGPYTPDKPNENISSSMSTIETRIRQAAVRVTVPFSGGHGSGSYIKYKDVHLVFTAQHVSDGPLGVSYLVTYKQESHIGTLIYSDPINDIAILYLATPFRAVDPIKFNPLEDVASVGTNIVYSGYPSTHKLMSFTGRVAGYENGPGIGKHIILQTYGWFGCSGSMIYTLKGQQIGVLYGVDVEYYPSTQVQENMIWVVPINKVKIDKALGDFCRGHLGKRPKACK